jgi:hypothetical protein
VLGLLVELLHQRSSEPDDRDLALLGRLIDELAAHPSMAAAALIEIAVAAAGSIELAGEILQEDPAEILRRGAVSAGWIDS